MFASIRIALCILTSLGVAGKAAAHDVWITVSGSSATRHAVINYGHPGDRPPAFADKVVDFIALKNDGKTSLREGLLSKVHADGVIVESKTFTDTRPALLAVRYDNGYWVRLADGSFRNATKRLLPDAAESLLSLKFAKAVTAPDAPWQTELGHDLEIVPLSDPSTTKPGTQLRVRVIFRGKPLARGEVERGDGRTTVPEADIPRFTTDEQGVASIQLLKPGPTLLAIDHRVPDGDASAELYNATFWFVAPRVKP